MNANNLKMVSYANDYPEHQKTTLITIHRYSIFDPKRIWEALQSLVHSATQATRLPVACLTILSEVTVPERQTSTVRQFIASFANGTHMARLQ
jgi:hypothetical protein